MAYSIFSIHLNRHTFSLFAIDLHHIPTIVGFEIMGGATSNSGANAGEFMGQNGFLRRDDHDFCVIPAADENPPLLMAVYGSEIEVFWQTRNGSHNWRKGIIVFVFKIPNSPNIAPVFFIRFDDVQLTSLELHRACWKL